MEQIYLKSFCNTRAPDLLLEWIHHYSGFDHLSAYCCLCHVDHSLFFVYDESLWLLIMFTKFTILYPQYLKVA